MSGKCCMNDHVFLACLQKSWTFKTSKILNHNPFFTIGWPSEKSSDVARTRLGPVSQIVNRLAPEFFLGEMFRVQEDARYSL